MIASTIARNTSIFLLLFSLNATAQPIYTGQRLAIFGFEIAEVSERNINITCRVVNTGHLPVQLPADASQTVIELDSMNVPSLLDQRQADISAALAQKNLMLQPGAFKNDLNLRISIEAPVLETSTLPFPRACADLAFDTAYLVEYDGSNMRLRYILRNIGTAPVALFGEQGIAMTINAYFVSGQRITRGAIPAATTNLRMGRETLDGSTAAVGRNGF
jgi:hypothetical protein